MNHVHFGIIHRRVEYRPWIYFCFFIASNILLSYFHFALPTQLFIGLGGLIVPFITAAVLLTRPDPEFGNLEVPSRFFQSEIFPRVPSWLLGFILILFFLTRFYKLTSVPFWPLPDEGLFGYYANETAQRGEWRILYGPPHVEGLWVWGQALFLKATPPSLWSLKLYPCLIYSALFFLGYSAARPFFSKTIALAATCFFGFNFWFLVLSRQCQSVGMVLLFELACFYLLGTYQKVAGKSRSIYLITLGLFLGAGFYAYTSWPVMAALVFVSVAFGLDLNKWKEFKKLVLFGSVICLVALPWVWARLSTGGTEYLQSLLGNPAPWAYFSALFWNGSGSAPFGPSWGGMLNPVLSSLLFIGFLELWQLRSHPISMFIFFASIIFFIPGALTSFVEISRVTLLLPLFALTAVIGLARLLSAGPKSWLFRGLIFMFIFLSSFSLDIYHYCVPQQDWNSYIANKRHWLPVDLSKAYKVLESSAQSGEKMKIMICLNNNEADHTLEFAACSFDRDGDPLFLRESGGMAAVLVNANYEPFLKEKFVNSEWYWLSPELPNDFGGMMLGSIPWNPVTDQELKRWHRANAVFSENNWFYMNRDHEVSTDLMIGHLLKNYQVFEKDRFLESIFWSRMAFLYFKKGDTGRAREALLEGLRRGYPVAHFYNELGVLSVDEGKEGDALRYFHLALSSRVNRTSASQNLLELKKRRRFQNLVFN